MEGSWSLFLQALMLIVVLSPSVHGQCTSFEFPTMTADPDSYTAKIGAEINLPFRLDTQRCQEQSEEDYTITVSKQDKGEDIHSDVCKLVIDPSGSCYSFRPDECRCEEGSWSYMLTKRMTSGDEALWKWKVNKDGIAAEKGITFVALRYPPSVQQLTFQSSTDNSSLTQPLELHTSVDILCSFDKGYPSVPSAQLSYVEGKKLPTTLRSGEGQIAALEYSLGDVGCDDMGDISCKVPGASENMTRRLLVRCPPVLKGDDLEFISDSGMQTRLRFPLISYTKDISTCKVTKVVLGHGQGQGGNESQEEQERTEDCQQFASSYSLSGAPPKLTVEMHLKTVTEREVGKWTLTVANDVGTDDVTFDLRIEILPQIIELSLSSPTNDNPITEPVEVDSSVGVVCRYRTGDYPGVQAVLRNSRGVALQSVYETMNVTTEARHTLDRVGCHDSGHVRCDLPKARRNGTVTLLVRCPPRFTEEVVKKFEGQAGDRVELRFQFFTHTTETTGCTVTKVTEGHHDGQGHNESHVAEEPEPTVSHECRQFASDPKVIGTLPDGSLVLVMDRVTPQQAGTWKLTVSNGLGSDDVIFSLDVIGSMPQRSRASGDNKGLSAFIAGVVVVLVIISYE